MWGRDSCNGDGVRESFARRIRGGVRTIMEDGFEVVVAGMVVGGDNGVCSFDNGCGPE